MSVPSPDWLKQHGGELRPSQDGRAWSVYLSGEPHYVLLPLPARGHFCCRVSQTINGRRLDRGATYPSSADALRGGLEDLRLALGW